MNRMLAGLTHADYAVLLGYFVIMLGIGVYFWRYMKGMRDYFSGRNLIPWWLSGVSYYMTSFSAFLFVSYSENAHRYGFVALTQGWMVIPAVLVGAIVFSKLWRRARIDSPVEYIEERYGLGLRQTFGWANIPVRMIDNGLRLYATGLFVSVTLDAPLEDSIIWSGLITLAYTFAGGLWAVAVTDFVQFVIMMAGSILLVPLALARTGGPLELLRNAPADTWTVTAGPYTSLYLLAWFLLLLCNYNTSFGLVQRYYCVRDEKEARKTGLLVAGLVLIGTPVFILPALAARQFLPDAPSKDIYGVLCRELLPSGALGLIVAAMFSATMSSLSGDYNAAAAVLTNDVYRRLLDPGASQRRLVFVGRLTTVLLGLIPLSIALYVARTIGGDVLFRKMVTVFSVAAPPIAVPMLAGLIWRRASNAGAIAAFLSGIGTGLTLYFLVDNGVVDPARVLMAVGLSNESKAPEILLTLSTFLTSLAVLVAVSLLVPARGPEQERRERFLARLRTPVPPLERADREGVPSPWGAVGVSVMATAVLLLGIQPAMGWGAGAKTNLAIGAGLLVIGGLMWHFGRPSERPRGGISGAVVSAASTGRGNPDSEE